ncbi:hypothetical protein EYF80_049618 [Liparis tanakae]|uniref:Uncharacterized protein n=1 Tax=Liparis tanakae TaxID=230148 RepID=A0A4Z2FG87_9TELE|nr:hypothetical protein EYF80_049618 [Liparis tanakae]
MSHYPERFAAAMQKMLNPHPGVINEPPAIGEGAWLRSSVNRGGGADFECRGNEAQPTTCALRGEALFVPSLIISAPFEPLCTTCHPVASMTGGRSKQRV